MRLAQLSKMRSVISLEMNVMVGLFQGLMLTTTKSSNDIQLAELVEVEGLLYSAPTHCFTRLKS